MREENGELPPPAYQVENDGLAPARRGLDGEASQAGEVEGRRMTCEEASSLAVAGRERLATRAAATVESPLSRREGAVAALVARGMTNRQIGRALVLAEGTVARHVEHTLRKLGFHSRTELGAWLVEQRVREAYAD